MKNKISLLVGVTLIIWLLSQPVLASAKEGDFSTADKEQVETVVIQEEEVPLYRSGSDIATYGEYVAVVTVAAAAIFGAVFFYHRKNQ